MKRSLQIKIPHVRLNKLHSGLNGTAFLCEPLPAHAQHVGREIEANDVDVCQGSRNQDPACSTPYFKDRPATLLRSVDKKRNVLSISIGTDEVIKSAMNPYSS